MKYPSYPFKADSNLTSFTFESKGTSAIIPKLVEFSPIGGSVYNLAFGDLDEHGELDDSVISNNKDMELVLATVISIVVLFFETYPERIVFFTGSSHSRTRLYQIIIKKEYQSLSKQFVIEGVKNGFREPINLDKNYDAFLIRMKDQPDDENN